MYYRILKGKENEKKDRLFKEIMAENIQTMGRKMDIQIYEVHRTLNKLNLKVKEKQEESRKICEQYTPNNQCIKLKIKNEIKNISRQMKMKIQQTKLMRYSKSGSKKNVQV